MKVTLQGLDQLSAFDLGISQRRLDAALAVALTRTAVAVRDAELAELRQVIDRPTPYTERCLLVRGATAHDMRCEVWFTDEDLGGNGIPASYYMTFQVNGGRRGRKRFEEVLTAAGALPRGWVTVPGVGAQIDQYGNQAKSQLMQIMSQLRVQMVAGFDRAMSYDARRQIAAQRRAGGRFFVMPVGKGWAPGIYQREFGVATGSKGQGINARGITPVVMFVRSARYKGRYDFHGVARRVIDKRLEGEVMRAVSETLERAARAGTQMSLAGV